MQTMIKLRISELLEPRPEGQKSLYWLAKTAEIEYGALHRLINEKSKSISFEMLDRICTALGVPPGEIFIQVAGETPAQMRKSKNLGRPKKESAKQ